MGRKYEYLSTSNKSFAGEQCTPSRPRVPLKEVDEWELINGAASYDSVGNFVVVWFWKREVSK